MTETPPGMPPDQLASQLSEPADGRRPIRDRRVLAAFARVPRPEFVPEELRDLAWRDGPLPIREGATISQPYIVASMTEWAEVGRRDRVLEIGTGSGYQTAILAELADDVRSVEIVPELAARARAVLDRLGYTRVRTRVGDGWQGWPEASPYDVILVTAAPEAVPPELVAQLAPGGRLVVPVGEGAWSQELLRIRRRPDGSLVRERGLSVRFVPLVHA